MNQYSFDYFIECNTPPNSATLTVTYTTPPPIGLVPQLHLGNGVFVNMSGSGPYTYVFSSLSACDFSFFFWMAYIGGGLYQSPEEVAPENTVLPIELEVFSAQLIEKVSVFLEWKTLSEVNSHYFEIERTKDGQEWQQIAQVEAAGNSAELLNYFFVDQEVFKEHQGSDVFYYRLKMIDLDGSFEYSDVVSARSTAMENEIVIFPNPVSDRLLLDLSSVDTQSHAFDVSIFDSKGSRVMSFKAKAGTLRSIDLSTLKADLYSIRISNNLRLIYSSRIIKMSN